MAGLQLTGSNTNQDLASEINVLCGLDNDDTTEYPLADKVRRLNGALEEVVAEIINADGDWQFDDTNHTDLPVGTINLVASQQSYTFMDEFLSLEQVRVKNADGFFQVLKPIDPKEFKPNPVEEYFQDTGLPTHYDKIGDTILLYPSPTAATTTLTAGLKVNFKRTIDYFTTSDTTQKPGIPTTHHILLAYMAAIPYCLLYRPNVVRSYEQKVAGMKDSLLELYARREKEQPLGFSNEPILHRVK